MRKTERNGPLSVRAISGSYVTLLGIDMEEASTEGLLGFAIERIDHTRDRRDWLAGFKVFPDANVPRGRLVSSHEHPIQSFQWCDFTPRKNHDYTYRIIAMRGLPGALQDGEEVSVRIQMENEDEGEHAVYFNRGVAGSQAYVRKFGNRRPDEVPNREAFRWLSRGLFRAMLAFIAQADGKDFALRACVYEFKQGAVLKAFRKAKESGADVKIVFDDRQVINASKPENSKVQPSMDNREAIDNFDLEEVVIPRRADPNAISHNKFIILLKRNNEGNLEPQQVWTGSTNMTEGGIFGHSNVGHIVRDPDVAAQYLKYWEKLSGDPAMARKRAEDKIRPWNEETSPVPDDEPQPNSTVAIFSPRSSLRALEWYAERMDAAQTAVFLTAAFGVTDIFEEVFTEDKDYLRYLLLEKEDNNMEALRRDHDNRIAVGNVLGKNAFEQWLRERFQAERLSGLNQNVKFIHTKYMLIDPLSDDPIVITGSANFSDASTRRNDENMLVIRGDTRVADIYLGEFMRLFNHFYFRFVASSHGNFDADEDRPVSQLIPDDSWRVPYFQDGTVKQKERLYFAGP
jgi:phosphatidylserine/phosphatidylglycerophosphate/cardiolipin synthase-like enzyme